MSLLPLQEVNYTFGENTFSVLVPQEKELQAWYELQCKSDRDFLFPFWAKIWPAAIGLCTYLGQNPCLLKDKTVLELAAGLGLPSLLAARWVRTAFCTDISAEAVAIVQQTAAKNKMSNLESFTLNWNDAPPVKPDVLLLSDVNYSPDAFDALYKMLEMFLHAGTTIVLSTPQRIMAKPFINRLLPFCTHQQAVTVTTENENMDISIFVLQATGGILQL